MQTSKSSLPVRSFRLAGLCGVMAIALFLSPTASQVPVASAAEGQSSIPELSRVPDDSFLFAHIRFADIYNGRRPPPSMDGRPGRVFESA